MTYYHVRKITGCRLVQNFRNLLLLCEMCNDTRHKNVTEIIVNNVRVTCYKEGLEKFTLNPFSIHPLREMVCQDAQQFTFCN